jgi:hypothetical protein
MGVTNPIRPAQLELFTEQAMSTARRLGVSPMTARGMILNDTAPTAIAAKSHRIVMKTVRIFVAFDHLGEFSDHRCEVFCHDAGHRLPVQDGFETFCGS